jgi:hypothetical protein
VGDAFETVSGGNLLLYFARKTLINFNHFRTPSTDQVVMVPVVIFTHEFKPSGAIAKIEPFDHSHFFEHMDGAIDGRQVAFSTAFAHFGQDFAVCQGMGMFPKDIQDRRARAGNFSGLAAQTVFQGGQIVFFSRMRVRLTHAPKISRNRWKSKLTGTPRAKRGTFAVGRPTTFVPSGDGDGSATCQARRPYQRGAVFGHFSSFRGNKGAISPIVWPGGRRPQAASENMSAAPPNPNCA